MKSEPLQAGQVLYPLQDTTLICVPKGKQHAEHQRVGFAGAGEGIVAKGTDVLDLGPMATLSHARAVFNRATSRQELVVMAQDDLRVIAADADGVLKVSTLPLVPPGFVRFGTRGGSSPAAQHPGETVGSFTPWYMDGDAVRAIGYDPLAPGKRVLALLAATGAGLAVQFWDLQASAKTAQVRLPEAVRGAPVAAELVRHGKATWLLVATVEEIDRNLRNPFRAHALKLHALDWTDVSPLARSGKADPVDAQQLTTLLLANNVPGPVDPEGMVFKGRWCHFDPTGLYAQPPARAQISATLARLRPGVADQQLVLAWASGAAGYKIGGMPQTQPTTWTCHVAVVGCGADGKPAVLAQADPDVGFNFAIPGAPIFRVVASDLRQAGVDQVVLGYPAYFGKMESTVALMLYSLDEPPDAAPVLRCDSKTVVAATAPAAPHGNGRWGEFHLYLAAGVFGGYKAVQIITTARDTREAQSQSIPVVCGFVPVHPTMGLPPYQPAPRDSRDHYHITHPCGEPALAQSCQTLATIDWETGGEPGLSSRSRSLRFFALPSDLTGQSVVLGAPTFTQVASAQQILAVIQAPPFDLEVSEDLPVVSFNVASDGSTGYSVSNSKTWLVSDDKHFGGQLGGFSLSSSIHDSHGKGLDELQDTTTTTSVHFQLHTAQHDFMMVHEIGFDVWRYPVLRATEKNPSQVEVLVVYPKDHKPRLNMVPCFLSEYGYRPNSEAGMLLSYCEFLPGSEGKLGFDAKRQLFDGSGGISVVHEKNGMTETFDASKMNSETVGKSFTLLNTVSDSASIALQTELFDFLPASMGLGLTHSESYSEHSVATTHVTHTEHFSLSITGGSVKDDIYSFKIVPYIYNHAVLGCLMVVWDVVLTGDNWRAGSSIEAKRRRFDDPDVRLIRVASDSSDAFASSRSRAISFAKHADGTVDIVVELFNNSVVAATEVVCEIYLGKPVPKRRTHADADADAAASDAGSLVPPDRLLGRLEVGEIGAVGRVETRLRGQQLAAASTVTVRVWSDQRPVETFGHIYWNMFGEPQ